VFNVGPLVALEYLLELRDYDTSKEPTYLCILCDKKGDPRTVLTHLASYKHILQVDIPRLEFFTFRIYYVFRIFFSIYKNTFRRVIAAWPRT
jgi:hypothetical protein